MKRKIKNILLFIPGFQGLCRLLTAKHVRVLMYHRFSVNKVASQRYVDISTLREQLNYLRRYHPNWLPDDQIAALDGLRKWESCPVVITTDDGYCDFHDIGLPIFREFGLKPVLFVTINFVEQRTLLWWDWLRVLLTKTAKESLQLILHDKVVDLSLKSEEERVLAWDVIADHCRFMPHDKKEEFLHEIAAELVVVPGEIKDESCQAASWDQIVAMAESEVVIGAHTLSHPILSRMDDERAQEEILGSKQQLEQRLQTSVDWFCYPQGGPADYTNETKKCVEQAGFKGSYIAYQALDCDRYSLPRYCITEDMLDFIWCLCGAEFLVLQLRRYIGRPADLGDAYWRGVG